MYTLAGHFQEVLARTALAQTALAQTALARTALATTACLPISEYFVEIHA
jgi:hypothetical protein